MTAQCALGLSLTRLLFWLSVGSKEEILVMPHSAHSRVLLESGSGIIPEPTYSMLKYSTSKCTGVESNGLAPD